MDDDTLIHEELEHLARAYMAQESMTDKGTTDAGFTDAIANDLGISAELASSFLSVTRDTLAASQPKEQTALVSTPLNLPGDWLFRLEAPIETKAEVEAILGKGEGSAVTIKATRTGEVGESSEMVDFVFITDPEKDEISRWIEARGVELKPLFIRLAKTNAASRS